MSYSSRVVYTATAGQTQFDYPFPYLDKAHIHAVVAGTEVPFTWVSSSRIALVTPATLGQKVSVRRTTPVNTPLADFQNGSVLTGPDLQLAVTQSLYRDEEISDDLLDVLDPAGSVIGGGGNGVASVNGRSGALSLTASDVITGFGTQVGASLSAGLGITLSTSGGITTITSTGGSGGTAGVNTVNGRSGNVSLSAADVTSGFGAQVASSLAAGSGVSLSTAGGVTTIGFAASPVVSVNGRTGAVALTASDVSTGFGSAVGAALSPGSGISIATVSGITTITNTAGGGSSTPTPNTWSTTDHTANVTLSNGNETATYGAPPGSGLRGVRGITQRSSGKVYFESTITPGGTGGVGIGLATADQDLSLQTGVSGTNTGWSVSSYGILWHEGTSALNTSWVGGPRTLTYQIAVDLGNHKVWVRPTSGTGSSTWNNDASADPVTGVGGVSYTGGAAMYLVSWSGTAGDVVTINTGATSFIGTIPTGFAAWDFSTAVSVSSVNGRSGPVTLTAADVASGFGTQVASSIAAGSGISFSTSGGVTTITNTNTGGTVSSVAGRTGAVTLSSSDISGFGSAVGASLTAGAGVSLATAGGITTISASGSLAFGYAPAWENGITTGNPATTNTTNLNNLISALNAAGGGTIWFNAGGPYQINGTIHLKSNVSIKMAGGAVLTWVGGNSGDIISSSVTDVLVGCELDMVVNEGSTFAGNVVNLHSCQHNHVKIRGIGTSASSVFCQIVADSTAGDFPGIGRNVVFNKFELFHRGQCGKFMYLSGIPGSGSTFGGSAQGLTLNDFHNCQANNAVSLGIQIEQWADSNTFTGNTYIGLSGFGGIGLWVNGAGAGLRTVYNTRFEQLAIDTFGGGLSRYGTVLNLSAGMYCGAYFQDPPAENGSFVANNCHSYQWNHMDGATDGIVVHQKGVSTGL